MSARTLSGFGKKAIAVLMTLCLSIMMVPAVAFAAIGNKDFEIEVDASSADASNTSGADVNTKMNGVGVLAKAGHTGTAKVGNVNAAGTEEAPVAQGIYANADGGNANVNAGAITGSYNSAAVWLWGNNATGNVEVDSVNATILKDGYNDNYGVYSDAGKNGKMNVKVNGGVTIPAGVKNYTTAVYAKTSDATAESTVEVGDVSITNGAYALYAHAYKAGEAKITAGNVTAIDGYSGYSYGNGPAAVRAVANGGNVAVEMGNLEATGDTYVGERVNVGNGGKLTFNAGNNTISREGSYALDGGTNDEGSVANVTVGDITAKGHGVNLSANSSSTLNLKTGNISGAQYNYLRADGGAINAELGSITGAQYTGLDISGTATEGSKYTVTTGPITSENQALSLYTYAPADNPDKITVNGDLTSAEGDYNGAGIYASSAPGYIDLTVNGNVTSDYYTIQGSLGGTAHITGDVISTHDDDYVPAISSVAGKVPLDLLVEGTISSNGPALSNNAENYSRTTLTAWKIASAKGVLFGSVGSGNDNDDFAKTVNYIVKLEQPKVAGVTVRATKADGTALNTSHGLPVAHEGDKVYVKADGLSPCVKVDKAYNLVDGEKVELPKDEKGYYYTFERMGGGSFPLEIGGANLGVDLVDNHAWEVSWRWDGDVESGYTAATALFHCKRDSTHDIAVAADVESAVVAPTCTEEGYTSYTATVPADRSPDGKVHSDVQKIKPTPIDPNAHNWGDWKVTKEPTPNKNGVRTRVCKNDASHKQTETIPASGKLLVKMTAKGKKALKVSWSAVKNASGYEVYFARCNHKGNKNICKKVKTITSGKAGSFVIKKLKAQTSYKAFVMAYKAQNGQKKYMDTSLTMHAFTTKGSKKQTNPKAVTSSQHSFTIAKGETATIQATVRGVQNGKALISKNHAPTLRYISGNKSVAKVSTAGVIKGKKAGTCKVYAIAANGVRKAFAVKVS